MDCEPEIALSYDRLAAPSQSILAYMHVNLQKFIQRCCKLSIAKNELSEVQTLNRLVSRRNCWISFTAVGVGLAISASTFLGSGLVAALPTMKPSHGSSVCSQTYFEGLSCHFLLSY